MATRGFPRHATLGAEPPRSTRGVEVLGRAGTRARGLTFRAVDAAAGVPVGTTWTYFSGRDDLLRQIDARLHQRLAPDPEVLAGLMRAPKDRALVTALMQGT